MPKPRSKPFERFGNFVLFKKIDSDSFGELWRVAAIENGQIGSLLALRKLGGDTAAVAGAVSAASPLIGEVEGAALVRRQAYGVVNGEPYITWEYDGGRTLRHIVDRAREVGHVPVPLDQALAIGEKVAAALEYVSSVKVDGKRILHGSLIPQLVWVYEDGDVRVAGQYLNSGLLASMSNPEISREIGPYVAPEIRSGGTPTRATDVYSVGAILYVTITGQEPPDSDEGISAALSSATLMQSEDPVPPEICSILETAMATDPAARYPSAGDLKQAISDVLAAGNYAPTTFNLAFYLHNLLRKEMEGEAVEREKESKVNPEPYVEEIEEEKAEAAMPKPSPPPARPAPVRPAPQPAAPPPAPPEPEVPSPLSAPAFGGSVEKGGKSKAPLIVIALLVIGGGAAGVWYMTKGNPEPAPQVAQTAAPAPVTQTEPPPPPEQPIVEPVVTEIPGAEEAAPSDDAEAAKQKAMEEEVNRRVQEEMRKLQEEYNRELKKQQAASAASQPAETPKPKPQEATPKAAPDKPAPVEAEKTPPPAQSEQTAAVPEEPAQQQAQATPPPPPVKPVVKEGDLVVSSEVDSLPSILKRVDPVYPPIAAKQKISSLVIVSALVDERGKVIDAKVLRGDTRNLGFDEASLKAIRNFTFQPATKDGKKVKTWHSVPFIFGKQQ